MDLIADMGHVALTTILSLATMFLLTKLIGDRQMSQLSMFDYINGITIGSIAAELATDLDGWPKTFTALILYGVITWSIVMISKKSIILRRFFEGHSYIIYAKGEIYEKNLNRTNLDINEFLLLCRCQGYFDLQEIETAIMESNGKLSIMPKAQKRPTIPEDFGLNPTQEFPLANVVIDGNILYRNLKLTGKDEKWLLKQLHSKGAKDVKDILLATCSCDNQVEVYFKKTEDKKEDMFQ